MRAITLKGTQDGYELFLNSASGIDKINSELKSLLARFGKNSDPRHKINFTVLTGNRLFSYREISTLKNVFKKYPEFGLKDIKSNVITTIDSYHLRERHNVHVISKTIRNGQSYRMHGDVLFFGNIHQGGRLYTDGNIYLMGNVEGIVHAGFPSSEDKLIIGDLHSAQQVRIGEQFDVIADRQIPASNQTVAYVNDLHILSYGKTANLRKINPKFYNRIGGIM
ncbi:septum site-determining protein MinC [Acetilactobacillus jinshanensis]|uniref:Cell division inhibitor n=1 Tax=Acetilactobacillus jinshanensis TaxID=1720083 RepID=A0A4P6ZMD6_9LACO|nr:septum site-determining protein MinC [Acetilactobacillus jinshanensis]QBP18747.1 cell division inhibitor [Acetilactobacillus jinshanensis]URL61619.1 cell division inhibitor [uncultured bacterium]